MEETFDFQYKLSGSSKSSRPGSHKSSERGSGMEFNRLVSLQQYPDPRRLDLRASIIDPYERWLVREFKQRSAVSVFAIVDLSASVRFHGLQNGKNLINKILTSVMNSVRRYGDRFGLIGFDNKFRQDWFMPATQRVPVNFDTLNLQFPSGKTGRGHKGLMEAPNWLPKERCLLFFISDFHISLNLLSYFFSRTISHQVVPIINGIPSDTINEFPYNYVWNTLSETEDSYHVISGIISDITNNLFYVLPIVVYIDNFEDDIYLPSGVITHPVSGQHVNGVVDFTVLADDNHGINNVEFYINGTSVSIDSIYPFQYSWDTTNEDDGSEHTLSATVSDNAGNMILLQPVLVYVNNQ